MTIDKLNYETVDRDESAKDKHAVASQNAFRSVVLKAESMGMRVNTAKTQLLVVSDALSFEPRAHISDCNGKTITSGTTMKILGFHMNGRPTVAAHVKALRKRFRQKYWVLFNLKRHGFTTEELCKVYQTIICPVADYCSPVYHAMLTDEQDEILERCQAHTLRCILGKDITYAKMREIAGVSTLRQRRVELTDKLAQRCLKNPRFASWFPIKTVARSTRRRPALQSTRRRLPDVRGSATCLSTICGGDLMERKGRRMGRDIEKEDCSLTDMDAFN